MTEVAVIGGGVAGLTVAHELGERGYNVKIFEQYLTLGGKVRSYSVPSTGINGLDDLPAEHGFHFYPGFYKHLPDTMGRIPLPGGGTVLNNLVHVPTFSLGFDDSPPMTFATSSSSMSSPEEWGLALTNLFLSSQKVGLSPGDAIFFAQRMICALSSCAERREQEYENMSWADYIKVNQRGPVYKRVFCDGLARPLVALDPIQCNARTALTVLLQILQDMIMPGRTADRVLNGPTNETWIDPWAAYLGGFSNIETKFGATVTAIVMANSKIDHLVVTTETGAQDVTADYYVFAIPYEAMVKLVTTEMKNVAPELGNISQLERSWMTGLVYYYSSAVQLQEGHTIYADSPWALTSISELPFWSDIDGADIGTGDVGTIFSTIISNWTKPGVGTTKAAKDCTLAELTNEVMLQINLHRQLMSAGPLDNAHLLTAFLDPSISFDTGGVVADNAEPLLINTVGSFKHRPSAHTQIQNLFLAGDYVKTMTNLATTEGACEAGRMAASGILLADGWTGGARPLIFPLSEPPMFDQAKIFDSEFFFPNGMGPPCASTLGSLQSLYSKRRRKHGRR